MIKLQKKHKNILSQMVTFASLILMIIFFTIKSPYFFNMNNFLTIALQTAIIGIIAVGSTFVIITSGIDLSVGSIVAFSGVMTGIAMKACAAAGMGNATALILGIALGLLTGMLLGMVNGLLIAKAGLPPFISTLGMMMVARGLVLVITNGIPITGLAEGFDVLSGGDIIGIPNPVIILIIVALIFSFVLSRTTIGKFTYALGSNEEAARLSGVNTNRVKVVVYSINGFLCGLSGVLLASRLVSAQPTEGTGYEMDVIASVVIGGASLAGGTGTVLGTILGAFIMSTLRNGLNLLNVSGFWQQVAVGLVVLSAVYIDNLKRRK